MIMEPSLPDIPTAFPPAEFIFDAIFLLILPASTISTTSRVLSSVILIPDSNLVFIPSLSSIDPI